MQPNEIGLMLNVGQDPVANIRKVTSLGLKLIQMGSPGDDWLVEPKRGELQKMIADAGLEVFTVFVGFEGESYADVPTVKRTVGYADPATREARLKRTYKTCDLAKLLGAKYLGTHIGFVPHNPRDLQYDAMVEVVRKVADYCSRIGLGVSLETGQEPADVLVPFIKTVNKKNLTVNFDPANMILYGSGDPHEALAKLKKWVVSVHVKDGLAPTVKDQLGTETPLGAGAVNIPKFINGLKSFGFKGPLVIEREITGSEQVKDVKAAIELIEKLRVN